MIKILALSLMFTAITSQNSFAAHKGMYCVSKDNSKTECKSKCKHLGGRGIVVYSTKDKTTHLPNEFTLFARECLEKNMYGCGCNCLTDHTCDKK